MSEPKYYVCPHIDSCFIYRSAKKRMPTSHMPVDIIIKKDEGYRCQAAAENLPDGLNCVWIVVLNNAQKQTG